MEKKAKIFIAGHTGMVGSAIHRRLAKEGYSNFLLKSVEDIDLRNQQSVNDLFRKDKPEYVILAAAKVGGIMANNTAKAEFLYDNLMIEANIIHASYLFNVKKLLFLGSSCIYPKLAPQPLKEEYLLTGALEPTNDAYALAKIAGVKLCETYKQQYDRNFISCMPTNLYGSNDNYDLNNSHVLPALLRKFHEAKVNNESSVEIWGTGNPLREFLHVNDLADACCFLMQHYNESSTINVGSGEEISIRDLSVLIKKIVGYSGEFFFNTNKPDGTPRKLLDVSRLHALGWKHSISLEQGIREVYKERFLKQ
jgi:GDP-L-fucose synthase